MYHSTMSYPLHLAAYGNQSEVAQILTAGFVAGADLNVRDNMSVKGEVTVPAAPLAAIDSVLVDGHGGPGTVGPL